MLRFLHGLAARYSAKVKSLFQFTRQRVPGGRHAEKFGSRGQRHGLLGFTERIPRELPVSARLLLDS